MQCRHIHPSSRHPSRRHPSFLRLAPRQCRRTAGALYQAPKQVRSLSVSQTPLASTRLPRAPAATTLAMESNETMRTYGRGLCAAERSAANPRLVACSECSDGPATLCNKGTKQIRHALQRPLPRRCSTVRAAAELETLDEHYLVILTRTSKRIDKSLLTDIRSRRHLLPPSFYGFTLPVNLQLLFCNKAISRYARDACASVQTGFEAIGESV